MHIDLFKIIARLVIPFKPPTRPRASRRWCLAVTSLEARALMDGDITVTVVRSATQPDGKMVDLGFVDQGAPSGIDFAVVRLNKDRSPDPSFGDSGLSIIPFDHGGDNKDSPGDLAIQADGKVVVVG